MLNQVLLEYFRSVSSIMLISISAFQDVKRREVDDRVWLVFLTVALVLNTAGVLTGLVDPVGWLSAGLQSLLFILLYYAGAYGGADAKSLICLSVMYPTSLMGLLTDLSTGVLPTPLSAFDNAIVLSMLYLPLNLSWNIALKLRGVRLFEGLEDENPLKKSAAILLLRKTKFSNCISSGERFMLAEKRSRSGARRIVLFRRLGEEIEASFNNEDYVFTNFLMPFQVLVLVGLVLRLLYVDILLSLALIIVRPVVRGF